MSNHPEHGNNASRVYLDHNATTPLHSRARAAMTQALDWFGNPSSIHSEGRRARAALESARADVAGAIGGAAEDVVFTSGGTEANALGVLGLYRLALERGAPPRIAVAAIEHPSVHAAALCSGAEVVTIPVSPTGHVEAAVLLALITRAPVSVCAVALANHETGTRQDITALASVCRGANAFFFCDAVQALGKIDVRATSLGADAISLSAHKAYGPKGIGALWTRPGLTLAPALGAGHQERGRRPGTENLIGAVGFGAAVQALDPAARDRMAALSRTLEAGLLALEGSRLHGGGERVPGTVNVGFNGVSGEVMVQALDLEGISVSAGAACTSGTSKPSPVIAALGHSPERAGEAVRFSLGRDTTDADIDRLLRVLPALLDRARQA